MYFISYEKTLIFIIMIYSRIILTRCKSTCTLKRVKNFLYLSFLNFQFFLTAKDFVDARSRNNNTLFFDSFDSILRTASESIFFNISFSSFFVF